MYSCVFLCFGSDKWIVQYHLLSSKTEAMFRLCNDSRSGPPQDQRCAKEWDQTSIYNSYVWHALFWHSFIIWCKQNFNWIWKGIKEDSLQKHDTYHMIYELYMYWYNSVFWGSIPLQLLEHLMENIWTSITWVVAVYAL